VIVQLLVTGIALGSMYGLVALGYHITWVTSRTMNFSQGHAVMAGAVVAFAFYVGLGWPLWATVLATLVVLAALGIGLERPTTWVLLLTLACRLVGTMASTYFRY
jgi:branched-chain amino acid transport system permease protein